MNAESRPIQIYTFRRLRILKDGAPLAFTSKFQHRPLELLKVLLSLGTEQVHIEQIAETLWPESEGDAAQRTFASTLHRLRKLLGPDALLLAQGQLSLNLTLCWVDAHAFRERLQTTAAAWEEGRIEDAAESLGRAIALYEGPFLDGQFDPAEILVQREKLHSMFLRHIKEVSRDLTSLGRNDVVERLLTQAIESDALTEELYQGLIAALQRQGRITEALAVYRRCRDVLQAHLGSAPSPETEALHRALLAPPAAPVAGPASIGSNGHHAPNGSNGVPGPAAGEAAAAASPSAEPAGAADARPYVAVLPLVNLDEDRSLDALGAGVAEALITILARCRRTRVAARNSSFRFAGVDSDVREIGRELGVGFVLQGSVRIDREAKVLRITVQLADAVTGEQVWAERYDLRLRETFAMEDEIVAEVCRKLIAVLFRRERGLREGGAMARRSEPSLPSGPL